MLNTFAFKIVLKLQCLFTDEYFSSCCLKQSYLNSPVVLLHNIKLDHILETKGHFSVPKSGLTVKYIFGCCFKYSVYATIYAFFIN